MFQLFIGVSHITAASARKTFKHFYPAQRRDDIAPYCPLNMTMNGISVVSYVDKRMGCCSTGKCHYCQGVVENQIVYAKTKTDNLKINHNTKTSGCKNKKLHVKSHAVSHNMTVANQRIEHRIWELCCGSIRSSQTEPTMLQQL